MLKIVLNLVFLLLFQITARAMPYQKYTSKPKLVVVLVIDQFRSDYLTRFHKKFIQPGLKGEVGGFKYLMQEGAYFPAAEYDVLQSMTCPGHAMIMTGSHPVMMGIPLNEWYDRESRKVVKCTQDSVNGDSPQRLRSTTVGDELKNSGSISKVFSIALKARSAIMLGGHRADLALWFSKHEWTTSPYYTKKIPEWLANLNIQQKKSQKIPTGNSEDAEKSLANVPGIQITFEAAIAALEKEKLGLHPATDILAVSLSSHDMSGHALGPNAQEMEELTLGEDKEISKFLTKIKKHMGSLKDVVIVLTADHGIPPTVEFAQAGGIDAGKLDNKEIYKKAYESLDKKFGKPKSEWFSASKSLHYYLNPEALKDRGISSEAAQVEVKSALKGFKGIYDIATATEIEKGQVPTGFIGQQLLRQYVPELSGDLILIPRPFYFQKDDNAVTHMTGYTYDRSVPLIITGGQVKKGVYASPAKVLDLAPTLSFMLGVLAPATSSGRILSEIFD